MMKKSSSRKTGILVAAIAIILVLSGVIIALRTSGSKPKNLILLIGDGMGPNQVAMARDAKGGALYMDSIPYQGTSSTLNFYGETTDSAAGGTAIACGIKTKNRNIGVTHDFQMVPNLREFMAEKGKKTGLISTVSITDATPATFGAHAKGRGRQTEIAAQYIENDIDVILGGGAAIFSDELRETAVKQKGYALVTTKEELAATKSGKILGLFADTEFPFYEDGYPEGTPTLEEMTIKAIETLSKNSKGFFLMVEGGLIDHACSDETKAECIAEVLEFDKAVKAALDFTEKDGNTLVVVTADHETGSLVYDSEAKEYDFLTASHSATDVPVYAYGVGASEFTGAMVNTDINHKIKAIFDLPEVLPSSIEILVPNTVEAVLLAVGAFLLGGVSFITSYVVSKYYIFK